jgi:hypothetical protein
MVERQPIAEPDANVLEAQRGLGHSEQTECGERPNERDRDAGNRQPGAQTASEGIARNGWRKTAHQRRIAP